MSASAHTADIVIVGGGIAGASLAYFLARNEITDVVLLERESTPGYHSSGRSAAISREWDPDPLFQTLKSLSHEFFLSPPDDFSDVPIFDRVGTLSVVAPGEEAVLDETQEGCAAAGIAAERWSGDEAVARIPVLKAEHVGAGVFLPNSGNIAVHELLSGYLRHARAAGVTMSTRVTATAVKRDSGGICGVTTTQGTIHTRCLVNAAGAWADQIYASAGGTPIGITPMRRTIIVPKAPDWYRPSRWPHTSDLTHGFYVKPEGASIIASPMDEDAVQPCDAQPDELRIAEIADLIERFTTFSVPSIENQWAGLRSFAPDRHPVVGADPVVPGVFWLAGQGGAGISTSPALGRIAAELLAHGDTDLIDKRVLSPGRFI